MNEVEHDDIKIVINLNENNHDDVLNAPISQAEIKNVIFHFFKVDIKFVQRHINRLSTQKND
jgi:hypothetical protein